MQIPVMNITDVPTVVTPKTKGNKGSKGLKGHAKKASCDVDKDEPVKKLSKVVSNTDGCKPGCFTKGNDDDDEADTSCSSKPIQVDDSDDSDVTPLIKPVQCKFQHMVVIFNGGKHYVS